MTDPRETDDDIAPEQDTNTDDGAPGTLDQPREHDEGGDRAEDPVPDA
jgi:hypothetical protein